MSFTEGIRLRSDDAARQRVSYASKHVTRLLTAMSRQPLAPIQRTMAPIKTDSCAEQSLEHLASGFEHDAALLFDNADSLTQEASAVPSAAAQVNFLIEQVKAVTTWADGVATEDEMMLTKDFDAGLEKEAVALAKRLRSFALEHEEPAEHDDVVDPASLRFELDGLLDPVPAMTSKRTRSKDVLEGLAQDVNSLQSWFD